MTDSTLYKYAKYNSILVSRALLGVGSAATNNLQRTSGYIDKVAIEYNKL